MSTNDSPSLNNNRKLTASFSSPEFNESSLLSSSSVDGVSESSNITSIQHTISSSGTNVRSNQTTNQTTITTSNSMIKSTSTNNASNTTTITTTGIKLNTTRDSGFSDSLIEDSTTSSNSQFLTRSETLDPTTANKTIAKLNSVDEDNAIGDKDDLSKEFITIVKTTKVTTKVKHIKNNPSANTTTTTTTTKNANGKNKKNKKNKNKIDKIDENRQLAEIVTEIITENESTISANINGNNQLINGNIQASRLVTQATNNGDSNELKKLRIEEDDERTSNSSEGNNNDIYDEEDEEDSQIAELNGLKIASKKKQKDDQTVIKVNINKSTEELVFQALPPNKSLNKLKEEQKDSLATNTYSTTQPLSTTLSSDLNTSILDSEELLSDYSASHVNPTQLDISVKQPDLNASFSSSIKEIPNVIDFVLNDVTNNNNNNNTTKEKSISEAATTIIKKEENKNLNGSVETASNSVSKTDKKKKRKFNIFSKASRDSKRKLNKKDDLLVESPSKQPRKEITQGANTHDFKNIISFQNDSAVRYQLLDDEQKDRIIYLKQESIDTLMNYFVEYESNSNTKTQLTNLKNQPELDNQLGKMLARSLDLLRHDKIETFDKLAAQLKIEYQINDSIADEIVDENFDFNALNSTTNDLIFRKLLQEALIDKKLLLNLNFDKSNSRPIEEVIDFGSSKSTSTPIIRQPVLRPTEKLEQDIKTETTKLKEEIKLEIEQVKEITTNNQIDLTEQVGARIVLDTIKEPPIVFTSELEPKPLQTQTVVVESKLEQKTVEPAIAESVKNETPLVKNPSKKRPSKKRAANKKSPLSCMTCGASSIKKSEEELNKPEENITKQEVAKTVEVKLVDVEGLAQKHREIFSNLDPKPSDKTLVESEQPVVVNSQDATAVEQSNENDLPQCLKIDVEVNVKKEEVPTQIESESNKIAPTPPSTPEILQLEQKPKLDQESPIVEETPAIETIVEVKPVDVILNEKPAKKNKKAKKDKNKLTNEIQLTSSGVIDVSVIDVKIETFIEPEVKPTNIDSLTVQAINESQTEQTKIDIVSDEPVKISIQNIQMENEQFEIERKSFSELLEITHTAVIEEDKLNELPVHGSNLDIKTEIDIGIEKEIVKEEPESQQQEVKTELEVVDKPPKSDDIVVLPEPPQVQMQLQPPIEITSIVVDKSKVEENKKVKKEKKTKASCFSCRAKKAKKTLDDAKLPIIESQSPKNTTPPLATGEEVSKEAIALDSPKNVKSIQVSVSENSNLFVGLDRRPSEKPLDVPSIYTIEINEKATNTNVNLQSNEQLKEDVEKVISPSMIGSTSFESNQEINQSQTANAEDVSESKPVEVEVEKLENDKNESENKLEQVEVPKVLSNDIVVLPEPQIQSHVKIVAVEQPKLEIKKEEPIVSEKSKKKKSTSCFPKSKAKKDKSLTVETKPTESTKPVQLKLDEPDSQIPTVEAVAHKHKIIESWSIGLDRKDDDVVERRDPVGYIATEDLRTPIVEQQPESVKFEDKIEAKLEKVEDIEKIVSVEELKQEESSPIENQEQIKIEEVKDVEHNLSEGSWVVIEREPDHAVLVDMSQQNVIKSSTINSVQLTSENKSVEVVENKDENLGRKTLRIDMPLINIGAPKSPKSKKKRDKKKKSKKTDDVVLEETKAEGSKGPTTGILDMPLIDVLLKKSKSTSKEPLVETSKPNEVEQVQESPKEVVPEPIVIESNQEEIKENTPEISTEETVQVVTELKESKENIYETIQQQKFKSEETSKIIEEITIETKIEDSELAEEVKPEIKRVESQPVHVKLDREPDVVKLPEPEDRPNVNVSKVEVESTQQQIQKTVETPKQVDEKHKKTGILDMPLINILVPKAADKKQKKKKSKVKESKQVSKQIEVSALKTASELKPKEPIPELLVIDVPTLDIVKTTEIEPKLEISIEQIEEKQEIKLEEPKLEVKEDNFDAKIPVLETSVDNFNIKIEEIPKVINESKLEKTKKEDEVPLTQLEKKVDLSIDDGSWVIINRQPDHAVIPIVTNQQPTVDILKPAETTNATITPAVETHKQIEIKKSKSKKPISCFSCKGKESKKQKEAVVANEPTQATNVKSDLTATELKPIEVAKQQTEFMHDFSGLDRRDSQEPIRDEPVKEVTTITEESIKTDAPKEEIKAENIEELIKEELKEVDKQYAEYTSKVVETHEVNVETFEAIAEQVVSVVNESETITSEMVTEKYELEIETKVVENEVDEATKRLDDVLESAEIEIKKLDESFDLKIVKEEPESQQQEVKTELEVVDKPPKSDDIVVLPEPPQVQMQLQPPIEITSIVVDKSKVEENKKVKKEKKTKASCFSCRAKKAKEVREKLNNQVPQSVESTKKEQTEKATTAELILASPKPEISYDPNVFKGLDRLDDSQLVKQPVDLDEIKVEPAVLSAPTKQDDVFNEVIQEIIVETNKLTEETSKTQIIQKETSIVVEEKQQEQNVEFNQSKTEQVADVVVIVEEEKKQVENLNVSLEIPSDQMLCQPQASSSPKKLSDDIVVLPEPVIRTPIPEITKQVNIELPQKQDEIKNVKKPNTFVSFICGKKGKKTSKKKEKPTIDSKLESAQQKNQQPPLVIIEAPKLDDLETKEPTCKLETKDISSVVISTEETPVLPVQPPKKPPRGHLDASVLENDIETLIPKANDLIIESKEQELSKVTETKCQQQLDVSHVLIYPQVTLPLKIDVQSVEDSTITTKSPKASVVQAISEQQILTTNLATSLLSSTESKSFKSSSTVIETKVIEYPSVIDIDQSLLTPNKRVTTWTTDPLPHVQIGLHKINTDEPPKESTVEIKQEQKVETTQVESKLEKHKLIETVQQKIENETVKLLSKDEIKLLKSKRTEAIDYLKQKAGYTITSSSTKHEKEKEKIATKLFKRGIEIVLKNKAKEATTYTKLNKKLNKEVSAKKYSTEISNCATHLRQEIESDELLSHLKSESKTQETQQKQSVITTEIQKQESNAQQETLKEKSSSSDKLNIASEQPAVMKRCPSLTWREANERARILFYKGRVPSIHYNEKRDSFRVSMITSLSTNGTEKTTEVPVCDDDVRRLLNSCGLYWNGESISLLNKSDDIFSIAQQEAFDFLQLMNSNN